MTIELTDINPGDKLNRHAPTVKYVDHGSGRIYLEQFPTAKTKDPWYDYWAYLDEVESVIPAPIQVGDKVRLANFGLHTYEVRATEGGYAFLKDETGRYGHEKLDNLVRA